MNKVLFLLFMFFLSSKCFSQEWKISSPDGNLTVTISYKTVKEYSDEPRLYYKINRQNNQIILDSPLGITIGPSGQTFITDLNMVEQKNNKIDETYSVKSGIRSICKNNANELTLKFLNSEANEMDLIFRAYNDGVAYRYSFKGKGNYEVPENSELSGFHLPDGTIGWAQIWQMDESKHYSYEMEYFKYNLYELDGRNARWGHPVLLSIPNGNWVLLAESDVNQNYCILHFRGSGGKKTLFLSFPLDQKTPVTGKLPFETPWRVIITGKDLGTIVESDIIKNLNPPSRISDESWIKPGRVAWSWWSEPESPGNFDIQKKYVDFAKEMTWEYVLVDEGWNETWIPKLVKYAEEKGIGIILWKRAWDFTEEDAKKYSSWGIKGVKLDFIETDRQEAFQKVYEPCFEITAKYKLLLNFHGSCKPSGEVRKWPHYLTNEAVKGDEYLAQHQSKPFHPQHYINVVMTRNVLGGMDFTPVILSLPCGDNPITFPAQLAHSVLYVSGLQHFCDNYKNYLNSPAKDFLKIVPVTWDDTKFIDGYPDRDICIARRKGSDWFIGANTIEKKDIKINLSFLEQNSIYTATIYRDGSTKTDIVIEKKETGSSGILSVPASSYGGFVIHLVKK